jgi:hypothetical protein
MADANSPLTTNQIAFARALMAETRLILRDAVVDGAIRWYLPAVSAAIMSEKLGAMAAPSPQMAGVTAELQEIGEQYFVSLLAGRQPLAMMLIGGEQDAIRISEQLRWSLARRSAAAVMQQL